MTDFEPKSSRQRKVQSSSRFHPLSVAVTLLYLSRTNIFWIFAMVLGITSSIIFGLACQGSSGQTPDIPMPQAPQITVNGTIVDITVDEEKRCSKEHSSCQYPDDKAVILIDEISNVNNPDDVTIEKYYEGSKVKVSFKYSARPAIIVKIPVSAAPTSSKNKETPSTVAEEPGSATPPHKKGGFLIFKNISASIEQLEIVILTGLEVGDRIKAKINYNGPARGSINVYEILN